VLPILLDFSQQISHLRQMYKSGAADAIHNIVGIASSKER